MKAIAVFQGKLKNSYVIFSQTSPSKPVKIEYDVHKLIPNSKHGFHIHTYGNLLVKDCSKCGGHWNPEKNSHGSLRSRESHAGDLGNIHTDENGCSHRTLTTCKLSLFGETSIIGRSVIIHSREDDLGKGKTPESRITGNAGSRLDCAIIGIMK